VGIALLPHTHLILAEWDRAWAAAEQAKASQRATLAVGMSTRRQAARIGDEIARRRGDV
jgi:catechol-2,3-dioxygenase